MGKINILDAASSNMIAAGEVVDRPASALKELLENSIDAGARNITIELTGGGNARIRVTDDGEGILREDMPRTLYRHATSKIKTGYDIDGVATLGFRGEALAAAGAVSRMEIISKTEDEQMGSRLICNETGVELYEEGCPKGTTVIISDLFYNVPARRKFMKKDSSEQSACLSVCEKLALSHPAISFCVRCDGAQKLRTPGDGKLYSALYALYGAQTASTFCELEYSSEGIRVSGYISKPESPRGTRALQSFFVNGRSIKSRTVQAALEEAYRSFIPSGKYPAAVLNIELDRRSVDVNVHPAKTEIKFSDERKLFSAVYYAVRTVLSPADTERRLSEKRRELQNVPQTEEIRRAQDELLRPAVVPAAPPVTRVPPRQEEDEPAPIERKVFSANIADSAVTPLSVNNSPYVFLSSDQPQTAEEIPAAPEQSVFAPAPEFTVIGELYGTYIVAELQDKVIIVDKHAAHERILYEELRSRRTVEPQTLLFPVTVTLSPGDCGTLLANAPYLATFGFAIEEFGVSTIAVREIPSALKNTDGIAQILESFARDLTEGSSLPFEEKVDKALYTVACKAAVKARGRTGPEEDAYIIENALRQKLAHCPHGRPFIKEIGKRELERYFDR